MRVAFNTYSNNLQTQLASLSSRQNQLQIQASSGQKIQYAEDDPTAMQQVLNMQAQAKQTDQYQNNIASQLDLAQASYTAINSLKTITNRVGEITTLTNDLTSSDQMAVYGNEINELLKQAVTILNTKNNNTYLFGGTQAANPPFSMETDENGNVTSISFDGNEDENEIEIAPNTTVSTLIPASSSSSTPGTGLVIDSASGVDLFSHMLTLRDDLKNGDAKSIANTDRAALQTDADNVIYKIGCIGAIQARLETAQAITKNQTLALNTQVSNLASADIAQTSIQLSQTQTAYQAAAQSSSKIMNMSLMDYLR